MEGRRECSITLLPKDMKISRYWKISSGEINMMKLSTTAVMMGGR